MWAEIRPSEMTDDQLQEAKTNLNKLQAYRHAQLLKKLLPSEPVNPYFVKLLSEITAELDKRENAND